MVKASICQCRRHKRCGSNPWVGKRPWSRKWQPSPGFLPEKSHGERRLGATVHEFTKSQRYDWVSECNIHHIPSPWDSTSPQEGLRMHLWNERMNAFGDSLYGGHSLRMKGNRWSGQPGQENQEEFHPQERKGWIKKKRERNRREWGTGLLGGKARTAAPDARVGSGGMTTAFQNEMAVGDSQQSGFSRWSRLTFARS